MTWTGWLQILVTLGLALATAPLLASHMARVHRGERTLLHPLLGPLERLFYRAMDVDPSSEQDWRGYSVAVLAFHAMGFAVLLTILLLQGVLPMNPQRFDGLSWHLALNTAVSFVTNTNWQSYAGESTMSHLSQMAGLTVQNFASAAAGIALAMAVTRAFARSATRTLGNFWVDLVRSTLYVLLPLSFVLAVALVARGVPQTFQPSVTVTTLEGAEQVIPLGPVASQEAIKQLGTNGGGYYNANSAHPLENPDAWTNLLATWALLALACALPLTFGEMVGDPHQGRALLAAMFLLLLAGVGACYVAEASGNPILHGLGVATGPGSMEGKEVRFGVVASALWAAATAGTSCGAVNAMHDSLTPLGGLVPLFLIQLGEVLPGGVGSGIYGMLVFAVLSVFVAGLMVGRTPEYLGKKIGADQMKMAMLAVLILPVAILGLAAVAASTEAGRSAVLNAGPHGLSEILYAYSSAGGNNGSAFAGLDAATPFYDTTLALGMILGRLGYVLPVLAMSGSLALQGKAEPSAGTLPTDGPLFVGLLVGVIVIVGGLQFLPALVLGPVVEHLMMLAGHLS